MPSEQLTHLTTDKQWHILFLNTRVLKLKERAMHNAKRYFKSLKLYIYIYIYIHTHTHHIYIYTHTPSGRVLDTNVERRYKINSSSQHCLYMSTFVFGKLNQSPDEYSVNCTTTAHLYPTLLFFLLRLKFDNDVIIKLGGVARLGEWT